MWVTLIRVYAAKAIDNEYAYGRLNAGQQMRFTDLSVFFYYTANSNPLVLGKSQKTLANVRLDRAKDYLRSLNILSSE